jgi:hypothetical protein
MPSSASQATGAARAHSKGVARRKRRAAEVIVGYALSGDVEREASSRWVPVIVALSELSEPRLGQILHESGLTASDYVRVPGGRWAR